METLKVIKKIISDNSKLTFVHIPKSRISDEKLRNLRKSLKDQGFKINRQIVKPLTGKNKGKKLHGLRISNT